MFRNHSPPAQGLKSIPNRAVICYKHAEHNRERGFHHAFQRPARSGLAAAASIVGEGSGRRTRLHGSTDGSLCRTG